MEGFCDGFDERDGCPEGANDTLGSPEGAMLGLLEGAAEREG